MSEFEHQGRTDHLESVLQAISVSRQTGILHVERGKGGVRDGGDIMFLHGQVVNASSASREGAEALEWLLTWGNCQYNFQVKFPNEVLTPPSGLLPSTPPVQQGPVTAPLKFPAETVTQNILQFFSGSSIDKEEPVSSANTEGYASLPDRFTSTNREIRSQESNRYQNDYTPPPYSPPIPEVHAPARVQNGSEALAMLERFRLSRLHRHVFLLLDGKRTAHDLVRLTGRPLNEVERLLVDLERTGLIYQRH